LIFYFFISAQVKISVPIWKYSIYKTSLDRWKIIPQAKETSEKSDLS
jgi:molybdopterin synthase catalytic subunit